MCAIANRLLGGRGVRTHAAPAAPLSLGAPIRAVPPSPDRAPLTPNPPRPVSPVPLGPEHDWVQSPTSLAPCWLQSDPERVNTHAAPVMLRSTQAPINALSPSPASATLNAERRGAGLADAVRA